MVPTWQVRACRSGRHVAGNLAGEGRPDGHLTLHADVTADSAGTAPVDTSTLSDTCVMNCPTSARDNVVSTELPGSLDLALQARPCARLMKLVYCGHFHCCVPALQFSEGKVAPPGAKIVYIDGAFDLFHPGHVEILQVTPVNTVVVDKKALG